MTQRERPLSPHLQVYRWQITMTMSILHRVTGVALSVGAFVLAWWLVALAAGGEAISTFNGFAGSLVGRVALMGFSFCLFYHLFNGLRHLLWDSGHGYEIRQLYVTGWSVIVVALLVTAAIWYVALVPGGAT